ncbi:hypothetical protein MA16_Dca018870 [Dendrobium catenatum]|uniref:Uncharacterized protein n=1 Tax=Dendrobium catenatum TaxID=906689 RepID=A0A2I0VVZ6_9ASPA|nr:hypothetical protein MA16_Dca018870 [Dendrobium catenatum]
MGVRLDGGGWVDVGGREACRMWKQRLEREMQTGARSSELKILHLIWLLKTRGASSWNKIWAGNTEKRWIRRRSQR